MVSIPTSQIKNIIYFDQNLEKENLKILKSKLIRKSILEDAQNKGYFLNLTSLYLNERFNVKDDYTSLSDNDNSTKLSRIEFIDLHEDKIQRLMCLEYCTGVVYLNLSHNSISDISALKSCKRLACLDVSSNVIETLPDALFWRDLKCLTVIYIHDNPISEFDFVMGLCGCQKLTVLTLSNTPLSLKRKYRHVLVNSLWSLKVLDNYLISDEEIIEDADFKESNFRSLSPKLKFQSYRIYQKKHSTTFMTLLREYLTYINQQVAHKSPVVIIQKHIRGFICRKKNISSKWKPKDQKPQIHKMPILAEEKSLIEDKATKDIVKYLKIDLKHLQTSLTIENLDREALLLESLVPGNSGYTYRSVSKSDYDKCSKEQITRALRKDDDHISLGTKMLTEINYCPTFRLMGINVPTKSSDPTSEIMIEKNRSHYVVREADRIFHENKLSFILPEIKSKSVLKTNSNILFRKSHGCMGLFLLNKWDKTDHAVMEMDVYHNKVVKIETMKYERELKQQDIAERTMLKLNNIKRSHEDHKNRVLESTKLDNEISLMKVDDLKSKQEGFCRQKSKIKKEISFSLNFRAKQAAASTAIDRFERIAIKQDQSETKLSNVKEIRENIGLKMDNMKSYIENQLCNRRTQKNLEKSALDMRLFQQMNNRMNEAKMRVEKLKTIHRLVSCPKLKTVEVSIEPLPDSG